MDFKKAIDTVPHKRLISKLKRLNISKEMVELGRGIHFKQGRTVGSKWQRVKLARRNFWNTTWVSPRTSTLSLIHNTVNLYNEGIRHIIV